MQRKGAFPSLETFCIHLKYTKNKEQKWEGFSGVNRWPYNSDTIYQPLGVKIDKI